MANPPTTLAQLARELDHIETALGDVLRSQDEHARCLRVLLKYAKAQHQRSARRKRRRRK